MSQQLVQDDFVRIAKNLGDHVFRFEGKNILITGGAGFLGKYLVGFFCHLNDMVFTRPCQIISVDNYITGTYHPHFNFRGRPDVLEVWADVTHPLPTRQGIHFMIHAAGLASPVHYKKYPLETIESCISGVKNLLELAKKNLGLEGFLFFSSSEIYGNPDPHAIPTPETYHGYVSSIGPRACYDESKRLGETIVTIYQQHFGVPATIVRPFNVFGPGMVHSDQRVLPMFAYQALNKQPIPVHGDGCQTRTFCYITDAIDGCLRVLTQGTPGEAYNIGNDQNEISIRNLAELFTSIEGNGASYNLVPYPDHYPAGEPQRRCPDITKAKTQIGFTPSVPLHDGLTRFISWCRNDPQYTKRPPI